ncbi:MAG: hypothetical protein IPL78_11160 [Chloroflexi bacterium]|nr:hypothetical protein [Chloroflexota bacterium]
MMERTHSGCAAAALPCLVPDCGLAKRNPVEHTDGTHHFYRWGHGVLCAATGHIQPEDLSDNLTILDQFFWRNAAENHAGEVAQNLHENQRATGARISNRDVNMGPRLTLIGQSSAY